MFFVFLLFLLFSFFFFFFFNDTATTEIYTLSLHDALPIYHSGADRQHPLRCVRAAPSLEDRKSTRLNSSHGSISYAVFCLKKKKKNENIKVIKKKQNNKREHHSSHNT